MNSPNAVEVHLPNVVVNNMRTKGTYAPPNDLQKPIRNILNTHVPFEQKTWNCPEPPGQYYSNYPHRETDQLQNPTLYSLIRIRPEFKGSENRRNQQKEQKHEAPHALYRDMIFIYIYTNKSVFISAEIQKLKPKAPHDLYVRIAKAHPKKTNYPLRLLTPGSVAALHVPEIWQLEGVADHHLALPY